MFLNGTVNANKETWLLRALFKKIFIPFLCLVQLEKALTYEKLMEWTKPSMMRQQEVQVSLPRFKMEETYDMKSLLVSMGMEDVFDGQKVNLSGMSPNNDLVVSKVVHKAFVEVNEEGTEAAGATGAVVGIRSFAQMFIADHPFLFFIRHNPSNSILFSGRFCSPWRWQWWSDDSYCLCSSDK